MGFKRISSCWVNIWKSVTERLPASLTNFWSVQIVILKVFFLLKYFCFLYQTSEQLTMPITACTFNSKGNIFAYSSSYDWSKVIIELYTSLVLHEWIGNRETELQYLFLSRDTSTSTPNSSPRSFSEIAQMSWNPGKNKYYKGCCRSLTDFCAMSKSCTSPQELGLV